MTRIDLFYVGVRASAGDAHRQHVPRVIRRLAAGTHDRAPTVLTIGKFDGVHLGHQAILARAREAASLYGATLTVMTFHPHPRDFFMRGASAHRHACAPRVASLRDTLAALGDAGVDAVAFQRFDARFAALSAQQFIDDVLVAQLRVRALFVGDDFRFGARRAGDVAMLAREGERCGFAVETVAQVVDLDGTGARVSSSAVREALGAADLAGAARMLGRPYSVSGRLVRCEHRDAYADAAWRFDGGTRSPLPDGAYAVQVHGIGIRPLDARLIVRHAADAAQGATPMFVALPEGRAGTVTDRRHRRTRAVRITFVETPENEARMRLDRQRMLIDMHIT